MNSHNKMEEILNASLHLFSTRGYLKTSMTDIAEAVGFTKAGIYHYIKKKEDLLLLIHNLMIEEFLESLRTSGESANDPWEKLVNWIKAHIYLMRVHKPHVKIFFTELSNIEDENKLHQIIAKRDKIADILYEIINEGKKQKVFRKDINPKILTFLIFGMLNWFYQWYNPAGPRSIDQIVEDVCILLSKGLLNPNLTEEKYYDEGIKRN